MSSSSHDQHDAAHAESLLLYALQSLGVSEARAVEARLATCSHCQQEADMLRSVVSSFVSWPTDVLRPSASLWDRLAERIAAETGGEPLLPPREPSAEAEWQEAAPGISCKLLSTDLDDRRVSMLVRLAPGTNYPPHRHAGVEELYLLHGELMVDDKKLFPGDYLRADVPSVDRHVWSETGCTCVLLTSIDDVLL